MLNDRQGRADLDQLANAFPGWLGEKALRGVGWLVVGLGYVVFLGVWLGGLQLLWSKFTPSDEWLARQNGLLLLVVVLGGGLGALFGMFFVGFLLGSVVASLGASIADPDAVRAFGPLAPKPGIGFGGGVRTSGRWFISTTGRRRLEQVAEERRVEWEARRAEEEAKKEANDRASARELVRIWGRDRVGSFMAELEGLGRRVDSRLSDRSLSYEAQDFVSSAAVDGYRRSEVLEALEEALSKPARPAAGVDYMEQLDGLDGHSLSLLLPLLRDGADDDRDRLVREAAVVPPSGQAAYIVQIVAACNADRAARMEVLRTISKKAEENPSLLWPP